jgi:hypothetical protein
MLEFQSDAERWFWAQVAIAGAKTAAPRYMLGIADEAVMAMREREPKSPPESMLSSMGMQPMPGTPPAGPSTDHRVIMIEMDSTALVEIHKAASAAFVDSRNGTPAELYHYLEDLRSELARHGIKI